MTAARSHRSLCGALLLTATVVAALDAASFKVSDKIEQPPAKHLEAVKKGDASALQNESLALLALADPHFLVEKSAYPVGVVTITKFQQYTCRGNYQSHDYVSGSCYNVNGKSFSFSCGPNLIEFDFPASNCRGNPRVFHWTYGTCYGSVQYTCIG